MTPQQPPTGIPQWLEQFLNSQGGMQGLLYQVGGMRGLLDLIQSQSQPRQQRQGPPAWRPPVGLARLGMGGTTPASQWGQYAGQTGAAPPPSPFGWDPWLEEHHPVPQFQSGQLRNGVPQLSNVAGYSHSLTPEEITQIQAIPGGTSGRDMLPLLPERFRGTMDPSSPEALALAAARDKAQNAFMGDKTNPELRNAYSAANKAYEAATLGPYAHQIKVGDMKGFQPQWSNADDPNMWTGIRGGDVLKPLPMRKSDFAAQYGYEPRGATTDYSGTDWVTDKGVSYLNKPYGRGGSAPSGQIMQTLRSAGWDPSKGWGPQEWTRPEGQAAFTDKQQVMLNDLLYSVSPRRDTSNDWFGTGLSHDDWIKENNKKYELGKAPDPFAGMQSAINRDAYVNDTLGGGFYGGLIPEQDAINTFGNRKIGGAHDPHFATPQLAINPLPGDSKYDTYAGWASDQGAAFGQAPWATDSRWGHAQGFDDPNRFRQPPAPPTAWQPTPQFGQGGVNTFAGTQGWGNTSRNGTQNQNNAWGNNTQQQQPPMSFGTSPWDNPWGMR